MAAIAKKHSLYASCVQMVCSFSSVYNMCIPEDQYNKKGKSPILFEPSRVPEIQFLYNCKSAKMCVQKRNICW